MYPRKKIFKLRKKEEEIVLDGSDILLGMKVANLNLLSYRSSAVDGIGMKDFEEDSIIKLNISQYKTWTYTIDKEQLVNGGLATTGLISNIAIDMLKPLPFVCFRGTYTLTDMKNDLKSMTVLNWYSAKGNILGKTGKGFIHAYESLRDLNIKREDRIDYHPLDKATEIATHISEYDRSLLQFALEEGKKYNGLIITGHSLGGALATLLASEIMLDYGEEFPIENLYIITFGAPRVFDIETSKKIYNNYKPKLFHRYVNNRDIITRLGRSFTTMVSDRVNDPLHGKNVPLTHCSEALFHKGTDWYHINKSEKHRSTELHDWVPRRTSLKQMGDYSYFFRSLGEPHLFDTKTGYLSTIKYSSSYQDAIAVVKNQSNKSLKKLFKQLPLCTVPKEWNSELFEICSAGSSICLLSFLSPCIAYGYNRQKFYNNAWSCFYGSISFFFCPILTIYDRVKFRSEIRNRYDIISNLDFCITLLCGACAIIQEYNELKQDPTIDRRPVFRKESWKINRCDILINPFIAGSNVCCLACVCPCFQFAENASQLNEDYWKSCCTYATCHILCCCSIPAMEQRYKIREKYHLKGNAFSDFYLSWFWEPFSIIQTTFQLKHAINDLPTILKKENTINDYQKFYLEEILENELYEDEIFPENEEMVGNSFQDINSIEDIENNIEIDINDNKFMFENNMD